MSRVVRFDTYDVRFPTSMRLDGSDAMNPSPDYSAAYLVIRTGEPDPGSASGEPLAGGVGLCELRQLGSRTLTRALVSWGGRGRRAAQGTGVRPAPERARSRASTLAPARAMA